MVTIFGAIHQSLFREFSEFSGFQGMETFNGTNSGESPAGSALTLVLGRGDDILVTPVKRVGEVFNGEKGLLKTLLRHEAGEFRLEFFFSVIHVLVGTECVRKI